MKNFKFPIVFSAIGFILSFVFGLFSGSGFFKILLTALIFGVVFAALSFLIQFLNDKFLTVESNGDSENVTNSVNPDAAPGQKVNIIIQDEELEQSGNTNHFDVGNNHQMLNDSDITKVSPQILDDISDKPDFVPVRRKETVDNISGVEAITPDFGNKKHAAQAEQMIDDSDDGKLGVLPDMSDFSVSSGRAAESGDSGSDGDLLDFSSSSYSSRSNEGAGEIKDASLMAKAISSILSGEES